MTWADFYQGEHDGVRFGVEGHSGWDVKGHPPGTPIPSPCAGVVVASHYNVFYGYFVTVECEHGLYCSRSHMARKGLPLGSRVQAGDPVGVVGNTGLWSQGPHVHCGQSSSTSPAMGERVNPRPHILEQLPRTAPATNSSKPISVDERVEEIMTMDRIRAKNFYEITERGDVVPQSIEYAAAVNRAKGRTEKNRVNVWTPVSSETARAMFVGAKKRLEAAMRSEGLAGAAIVDALDRIARIAYEETGVTDADAERIAQATADEIDDRARDRLEA